MSKIYLSFITLFIYVSLLAQNVNHHLLVGTYTNSCESKGIYSLNFNSATGDLTMLNHTENLINPSYLTLSQDKKTIYTVNENGDKSTVTSLRYNKEKANFSVINQQDAMGTDPCHIIADDQNVITANYSSGSISVFGITNCGILTEAKQIITHQGHSINKNRQEKAHAHMVYFSPDKKYILSNDLGNDSIYCYAYNALNKAQPLTLQNRIATTPGSGPRHLVFSKNGKTVYILEELTSTISMYNYKKGKLKKIGEKALIQTNASNTKAGSAAAIHISPNGKYLYASNRGDQNNITQFSIHKNGQLTFVNQIHTEGAGPRDFTIDPTGKFLLVANQYTNEIRVFNINPSNGSLSNTDKKISICSPINLVFE